MHVHALDSATELTCVGEGPGRDLLRRSGTPYTFLRPSFLMHNPSTTCAGRIRGRGEIFVPAGRSHTAFVDARDIGRVAAVTFTASGHLRKAYTLSGEQSLTFARVARIMTGVLGRPNAYARPSEVAYLADLAARGMPEDSIDMRRTIYRVVRANLSAVPSRAVRRSTGEPPATFRRFVEDHRERGMHRAPNSRGAGWTVRRRVARPTRG